MKVICKKVNTCVRPDCGAQRPHNSRDCEPCPIDNTAECVEIKKTVIVFEDEEIELKF